jgi:hypothetical protein
MDEINSHIKRISSEKEFSEEEMIEAANQLIEIISKKPIFSKKIIDSINEMFLNDIEMIKIRALEIALKLLDYSLYHTQNEFAFKILDFVRTNIETASENIQSVLIIHYSWAHRKFPLSKNIIKSYDEIISKFNMNPRFKELFDDINYMEGGLPPIKA